MEAEAKGNQEILTKQAEGMRKLVEAAGGDANAAVKLIVADKLEELISIQVEAIKNIVGYRRRCRRKRLDSKLSKRTYAVSSSAERSVQASRNVTP